MEVAESISQTYIKNVSPFKTTNYAMIFQTANIQVKFQHNYFNLPVCAPNPNN